MVKSDSHKFIFIHIPKSAGNSIVNPLKDYGQIYHFLATYKGPRPATNAHISTREAITHPHLKNEFGTYFKFTFFRNPWARMISQYYFAKEKYESKENYRKHIEKYWGFEKNHTFQTDFMDKDFNEWLLTTKVVLHPKGSLPFQTRPQMDWVSDENKEVMVDFIGDVDNINEDWKFISKRIGIPHKPVGQINTSSHTSYRNVYSKKAQDHIEKHFHRDIEYFGYKF